MRRSALWLLAVLAGGACTDLPSAPDDPGMRVVAGPSATDTIDAYPQQLLVVEVRDDDGIPIRDVEVTFASPVSAEFPATVSSIYALRTTDGNGRATTRLRFGTVAGAARLVIAVPSLALQTDATYQVQAGRPVQLQVPAQALTLGDTIAPTVRALDRHGNLSTLPVALSNARPPLALTDDQRLYGTAYGTAHVRVQVLGFVDSVAVTVVPEGWLAGYAVAGLDTLPAGIHRLTLDGRRGGLVAAQTLGMPEPYGIDWSPDGAFLAYGDVPGNRVMLVNTVSGAAAPLAGTTAFTRAHSPQFSPDGIGIRFWGRSPDGEGLWQAPLAGGDPALLVPDAPADAHLDGDGTRMTYALAGSIVIEDVASGEVTDPGVAGTGPRFSPDGRHLAFLDAVGRLALLHLGTGSVRTVALPGTIHTLDWSPLGAWLLAGGSAGTYLVSFETLLALPLHHHLRWPAFRFVQETAPPID